MDADKLVLVFYIGVGDLNTKEIEQYINKLISFTNKNKEERETRFFIPVIKTREIRIECLNPKLVNKKEYQTTLKKLQQVQKDFDEFMDSTDKVKSNKIKVKRRIKK
jgi:hypothetical protein